MHTKIRLKVDELMVDSFTTAYPKEKSGTVHGHQCTCPGSPTCDASCGCATNEYTCTPCTYQYDATCYNYGTCNPRFYCPDIP
jgi:hypothetical protein